jgi:hypothetical protein
MNRNKLQDMKTIGIWSWKPRLLEPKIDRRGDNECWPWLGSLNRDNRPLFGAWKNTGSGFKQQMSQATRIYYRHIFNEDCEEKEITHGCGNKNCMNPRHWEIEEIKKHGPKPRPVKQAKLKPVKKP